jgi:hypothetical protein
MWAGILKAVLGFGGGIINNFQERKQRAQDARVAWETVAGKSLTDSWKDEYVTVVVTFPILQNFVGNLVYAFTGKSQLLDAQRASMEQLGYLLDTPYGDLLTIVVLAAVGIKTVKGIFNFR